MRLHPIMMTYLSKLGHFSLQNKVGDPPIFFSFLEEVIYDLTSGKK